MTDTTNTATTKSSPHTPTDAEVEAVLAALGGRIEYGEPQPVSGQGARSRRKGHVFVRASIHGLNPHLGLAYFNRSLDLSRPTYLYNIFEGPSPEEARAYARRSVIEALRGYVSQLVGEIDGVEKILSAKRATHAQYTSALALVGAAT